MAVRRSSQEESFEMTEEKLKVMIAFPHSLEQSGGMEKACIVLANEMCSRGHKVRISCVYRDRQELYHPLKAGVELRSFMHEELRAFRSPYIGRCISRENKIIREFLRLFSKNWAGHWNERCQAAILQEGICAELSEFEPDVIVSFRPDMSYFLMYAVGQEYPIITSFRFTPEHLMKKASLGDRKCLNEVDAIHVLQEDYISLLKTDKIRAPIIYIPNTIPQYEQTAALSADKSIYKIIYAARINPEQKRQHLLLEAFSRIASDFPQWHLEFWGDDEHYAGSYTGEMKRFIQTHHLGKQVFICGKTHNMEKIYQGADIFCITSAFEGFSNALGEAMSAGLPAIGYKSCPGVREIIDDGKTGFLAADGIASLSLALRTLMEDKALRVQMGNNAHEAMKAYAAQVVGDKWERLLYSVYREHKNRKQ